MMITHDARTTTANGSNLYAFGFQAAFGGSDCVCFRHDNFDMNDFGVFVPDPRDTKLKEAVPTVAIFTMFANTRAPEAGVKDRNEHRREDRTIL